MMLKTDLVIVAAGLALGAVAVLYLKKKLPGSVADVAAGAVGVAADTVAGSAIGIGDVFGIPHTDQTECDLALAEGRFWDASFACPASTYTMEAVKQTVPYVNPADNRNVIYQGVNGIGGAITGDKTWNLGGWIYDITH